jgi:hypothetical protein
MTAKSVWGAVLIVLGVISVLSGFEQIGEIAQLDQVMQDTQRMFGKIAGKQSYLKQTLKEYDVASHNAKVGGAIKIVAGIGFALWGTWLLQDSQARRRKEKLPALPKSPHDWKFMKDEEIDDFVRPTKGMVSPLFSDPKRPEISRAECENCKKVFTYPTKMSGRKVNCTTCQQEFELP